MSTSDTIATTNRGSASDYRWLIIVAFYISAAIAGMTQALSHNALVYYLSALLLACTAAGWCVVDARRRDNPLPWAVQLLAFLFWTIAVPIYLVVSRGWRGLGWAALNALALFATFAAAYFVTSELFWESISFE
jgi:peptidoglycan/LPS O-acetylase OafA/YrhL